MSQSKGAWSFGLYFCGSLQAIYVFLVQQQRPSWFYKRRYAFCMTEFLSISQDEIGSVELEGERSVT